MEFRQTRMKPNVIKTETSERILNVAERHFALYGYAGASLRAIMKEAGVNVAAVAYHYGTKEDLFAAVVQRFAAPVVQKQLSRLRSLEPAELTVENIARAFYEPPLSHVKQLAKQGETLSLFLGRCQTEPEPVYSLVDSQFAFCRDEFIQAIKEAKPGLGKSTYQWLFEFMLSLIVSFLTRETFVKERHGRARDPSKTECVEMLVRFCAGGINRF